MPLVTLQERLAAIVHSVPQTGPEDYFSILPADHFEMGLPNLATEEGQKLIEPLLDGVSFLTLDNQSTLAATARDNDAESWGPMQAWLLKLRRRGMSVLLIHHAGKGGQQRGTSRREDVLDTVIALRRPPDYSAEQGARFEVHLEKARGVYGDNAKPFEARLEHREGQVIWATRDLGDFDTDRVLALHQQHLSVRQIAQETMISKSKVQRILKVADNVGGVR
jgi:putative DNA primase/helicase